MSAAAGASDVMCSAADVCVWCVVCGVCGVRCVQRVVCVVCVVCMYVQKGGHFKSCVMTTSELPPLLQSMQV